MKKEKIVKTKKQVKNLKLQLESFGFKSTLDLSSDELEIHLPNKKVVVIKNDKVEIWSPENLIGTLIV